MRINEPCHRSALALLLPLIGAGLTILSRIQLYISAANDTNGVGHFYCIIVLVLHGFLYDGEEGIVDVRVRYGRRLEVGDISVVFAPVLRLLLRHLAVVLVAFVAHDDEGEIVGVLGSCMVNESVFPFLELFKGFSLRQVEC